VRPARVGRRAIPSGRGRSPIWRRRPLGAITYGIYPTSAPGEARHLLQYGGAALIVVEDQEHLDKTLEVLDTCPNATPRFSSQPCVISGISGGQS